MPQFRGSKVTLDRILQRTSIERWRSLRLLDTLLDDDDISEICRVATALQEIVISSAVMTDRSMKNICALPHLLGLQLRNVPNVTDTGISYVAHARRLLEVYLENTGMTNLGIGAIADLPELWCLSVAHSAINDDGLLALKASKNLSHIDLTDTEVCGDGLAVFANLSGLNLYAADCPIDDDALIAFVRLQPDVVLLSLSGTRITDRSLDALAQLRALSDLRIERTHVTDSGAMMLAGHEALFMLYVGGTQITRAAVDALKRESPNEMIIYTTV
ncbi:MAG: hypothetical protein KDA75_02740 [Planctomycetaceae bacterium]|nr:hypothetical protein [Planctomycetaceae bacterium]